MITRTEIEQKVGEFIRGLLEQADLGEGRKILSEVIMDLLEEASGMVISGYDITNIQKLANSDTTVIQHLDRGKTIVMSPYGYDVKDTGYGYIIVRKTKEDFDKSREEHCG